MITYALDGSKSLNAKSYNWRVTKGAETFSLEATLNGALVKSVDSAHAYAVIPANSEGSDLYADDDRRGWANRDGQHDHHRQ